MDRSDVEMAILWLWRRKEAFIWIGALWFLAVSDPSEHHYTLCPLDNLGFHYCPGCGLGRSIGYFFRFDFESSIMAHPLGIPAVLLLLFRSVRIFFKVKSPELSTT
jgi:hypothetical protein